MGARIGMEYDSMSEDMCAEDHRLILTEDGLSGELVIMCEECGYTAWEIEQPQIVGVDIRTLAAN
jgi:hypothetical protein